MNYQAETSAIYDLTEEVKNNEEMKAAVNLMHLTNMFNYLEERNNIFNDLSLQRYKEQAGKPELNLKDLRKESVVLYRNLIKRIEAYAFIEPSPVYDELVKTINTMIDNYNQLRRKTKVKDDISDLD